LANKSLEKIKDPGQKASSGGSWKGAKTKLAGNKTSENIHCVGVKP
jgi:hypothetical protein